MNVNLQHLACFVDKVKHSKVPAHMNSHSVLFYLFFGSFSQCYISGTKCPFLVQLHAYCPILFFVHAKCFPSHKITLLAVSWSNRYQGKQKGTVGTIIIDVSRNWVGIVTYH